MQVDIEVRRKAQNHRLMHVKMDHSIEGPSAAANPAGKRTSLFNIE